MNLPVGVGAASGVDLAAPARKAHHGNLHTPNGKPAGAAVLLGAAVGGSDVIKAMTESDIKAWDELADGCDVIDPRLPARFRPNIYVSEDKFLAAVEAGHREDLVEHVLQALRHEVAGAIQFAVRDEILGRLEDINGAIPWWLPPGHPRNVDEFDEAVEMHCDALDEAEPDPDEEDARWLDLQDLAREFAASCAAG